MPTKPTPAIVSTSSQAAQRYLSTVTDQHRSPRFPEGRPWWGYREYAANKGDPDGFVGTVQPGDHRDPFGSVWTAPFYPEALFLDFNYDRGKIAIRYDRMLAHDRKAFDDYYESAAKICYEKGWPETPYGARPRHTIVSIIGEPPRSPKIAQAAMAGDRWLLGAHDEVNEELATLLGLSGRGLKIVREPITPVANPEQVLSMAPAQLQALIATEVAKAIAAQSPKRKHRRTRPLPDGALLPKTDVLVTPGKVA